MKLPNMAKPCKDCPFRTDCLKGWLGGDRMEEILEATTFVCHKNNNRQCAGHMQLAKYNDFVRLAEIFKMKLRLSGRELLFNTPKDCIAHHIH